MDENKKQESVKSAGPNPVKRTWRTYKAEFKKIVWPSRETLRKHVLTVSVVSLIFGAYIAIVDGVFGWLFTQFVQLVS